MVQLSVWIQHSSVPLGILEKHLVFEFSCSFMYVPLSANHLHDSDPTVTRINIYGALF